MSAGASTDRRSWQGPVVDPHDHYVTTRLHRGTCVVALHGCADPGSGRHLVRALRGASLAAADALLIDLTPVPSLPVQCASAGAAARHLPVRR